VPHFAPPMDAGAAAALVDRALEAEAALNEALLRKKHAYASLFALNRETRDAGVARGLTEEARRSDAAAVAAQTAYILAVAAALPHRGALGPGPRRALDYLTGRIHP
jgi:hypothetical protein